ncbi:hypothetical protein IWQ48_002030 [Labrenzia sp. EL_13]|nr:hypothetical protein [Labrenzia sp. EL_13]
MVKVLCAAIVIFALTAGTSAQTNFSKDEILSVQQELTDLGYDAGAIDGSLGWQTVVAIGQYQTDWQLPVTGTVDEELVKRLERKHRATEPRWHAAENRDCKVWNAYPMAQETMTYTGDCINGIASGKGRIEWSYVRLNVRGMETYEGGMRNGKSHGQGVFVWIDGTRYEGGFLMGDFSGQGVFEFKNGNSYKGGFKENMFHGTGVFLFANGNHYEGDFREDMFNGIGVFNFARGNHYEGGFKDDLFDGHGVLSLGNGDRYEGEFQRGLFHGQGFFSWANGNSHEGQYREGKPHGFGVYFTDDVETMRGMWESGCLNVDGAYRAIATSMEACGFE